MLDMVTAARFDKRMGSCRTKPILLACDRDDADVGEGVQRLHRYRIGKVDEGC